MSKEWKAEVRNKRKYAIQFAKDRTPENFELKKKYRNIATTKESSYCIWCQKTFVFFCPIRRQNGGDLLELVWQDIVPRGSSRRSILFFVPYFSAHLDFSSLSLSAPGSPRMRFMQNISFLTVCQRGESATKCLLPGCEHKIILSRCDAKSSIQ